MELFWKGNVANPHTSHCLGSGDILISCMGDPSGNGKGINPLHYSREVFVVWKYCAPEVQAAKLKALFRAYSSFVHVNIPAIV